MTTNAEMIRDALGLLTVLGEGQTATAEQLAHGLRTLNTVMADLQESTIDLDYFDQTEASDEVPLPKDALLGVTAMLAAALAPEYGKQIGPEVAGRISRLYNRLLRNSISDQLREAEPTRSYGEWQRSEWGLT